MLPIISGLKGTHVVNNKIEKEKGNPNITPNETNDVDVGDVCITVLPSSPSVTISNETGLLPVIDALDGLTNVVSEQKRELQSIANPNQADWMGIGIDLFVAILAAYAALKVHDIIKEKGDGKVHLEITSFWKITDDMLSDFRMYEWLFPFRLEEPVEQWEDNEIVRNKVSNFLTFSEKQSEKLKVYHKEIHRFERNLRRYGWRIHKKAENDFLELYQTTEYLFNGFGEYNCLTAKLFKIEKQFISPSMFFEFENLEWSERYETIDNNLARHIASIKELIETMQVNVRNLEELA